MEYLDTAIPGLSLPFQDTSCQQKLGDFSRREEKAINDFLLFQGSRSSYSGVHFEVQQILEQLGFSVVQEYSTEKKWLLVEREGSQTVIRLYCENHYTPGRDE